MSDEKMGELCDLIEHEEERALRVIYHPTKMTGEGGRANAMTV